MADPTVPGQDVLDDLIRRLDALLDELRRLVAGAEVPEGKHGWPRSPQRGRAGGRAGGG